MSEKENGKVRHQYVLQLKRHADGLCSIAGCHRPLREVVHGRRTPWLCAWHQGRATERQRVKRVERELAKKQAEEKAGVK